MADFALTSAAYTLVVAAGTNGSVYNRSSTGRVSIVTAPDASQPDQAVNGEALRPDETRAFNMEDSANGIWARAETAGVTVTVNLA